MKITLGGVRGSCPVAQPGYMKYGGETSAFLIEGAAGERILIDAGTGARNLGRHLMETPGMKSAWLFMTHYHLDHVVGLPMLPMFYSEGWDMTMAAPDHDGIHIREIMKRLLDRPFWPMQFEDLRGRNDYEMLEGPCSTKPFRCGSIEVSWCPVNHPGGCTAYRFDEPSTGASVVIATDIEWAASSKEEKRMLIDMLRQRGGTDLLLMDGQYDEEAIASYKGWGHSSWKHAVEVATEGKARKLLVIHHDPAADDDKLDQINSMVQYQTGWASLAREGMQMELPGTP